MKKVLLCLFIISFFLTGCKSNIQNEKSDVKSIAVSIGVQATFAQKICGDKWEILTAIPSGASPETYEPNPAELRKINQAEIYFGIGVPSEENFIIPSLGNQISSVRLQDAVKEKYPEIGEGIFRDPHIWLSPKRAVVMVETMANEIIKADGENKAFYQDYADRYIEELKSLDNYIKGVLEPIKNRKFLCFHPSFGYFAEDYGLKMYSLEEEGKETTAKQLSKMAQLAKKENIKIIFYQAEMSQRQALSFAEEIDGQAVMLEPLSPDYIENLKKMTDEIAKAMK